MGLRFLLGQVPLKELSLVVPTQANLPSAQQFYTAVVEALCPEGTDFSCPEDTLNPEELKMLCNPHKGTPCSVVDHTLTLLNSIVERHSVAGATVLPTYHNMVVGDTIPWGMENHKRVRE
jgi:hypothetical protein